MSMTLYEAIASDSHCLIAGATGSGKSVVLNGVLHAIVNSKSPERYSFCLIDPKRVELWQWRKVPHCLRYASEMTGVASIPDSLREMCILMDNRYKKLQAKNLKKWEGEHVAVIVDELADIATNSEVRDYFCKIARLGRAANIHLIVASQRISITDKLMPAEMRANIESRLCLRVTEAKDSRMVIGVSGAEQLPRYGYGFFQSPRLDHITKFEIPMVRDWDIEQAIAKWKL